MATHGQVTERANTLAHTARLMCGCPHALTMWRAGLLWGLRIASCVLDALRGA